MTDDPQTLVSTEWLGAHLSDPDLRIIDASWYLPQMERDARAEYDLCHIPGARFVDIDDLSDERSELPHMAPPVEKFTSRMRSLGIGDGHQVVVYDGAGLFSAARVWWLFRLMGNNDAAVLDGGFPKWRAENRPVEDTPPVSRERNMTAQRRAHLVKDAAQIAAVVERGGAQIADARAPERFRGEAPEPRPGLRKGHIPGARNVPFATLLNPDGTMKNESGLRAAFEGAGIELTKPIVTSCGSGVTAAVLSLALERLGHRDHALYDGSWAEWGMREDLDIETGDT